MLGTAWPPHSYPSDESASPRSLGAHRASTRCPLNGQRKGVQRQRDETALHYVPFEHNNK